MAHRYATRKMSRRGSKGGLLLSVTLELHSPTILFVIISGNEPLSRVCYLARARAMARVVLAQIEFARAICGSRKISPMLH